MKDLTRITFLILALSVFTFAQSADSNASGNTKSNTALTTGNADALVLSNTEISGQLQKSLDVKKAKVGDEVVLKTRKSIKQGKETVVQKGSMLIGRITDVQEREGSNGSSMISIAFESLQQGSVISPITATIVSVTQARARSNDSFGSSSPSSPPAPARSTSSNSSGGGLLGGVTNTVGGVVNTSTQTVDGLTDNVGQTVGGATRGIQISQSSDTSVSGSSTLSLQGENLKLDKGTNFNLRVSESVATTNN